MAFDIARIRSDFPVLARRLETEDGRDVPLVYMDHGASTHAPRPVLDTVTDLMEGRYANVHRGHHTLSRESSDLFEEAVDILAESVGGNLEEQVLVLGGNTTQSLDLAAHVMAIVPGKTVTTLTEHHSNDLPHRRRGTTLHTRVDGEGRIDYDHMQELLDEGGVKLLAVTGASNVTGLLPDIHRMARMAHDAGARILIDAAQLYAHAPIDVKDVDHPEHLDFVAAAGHKAYAPFGSSFLLGPRDLMDAAPPYLPGGGTVEWVTASGVQHTTGADRHQGGTPNIVGAIAFAAAARYLHRIGMDNIRSHEMDLVKHGLKRFAELEDAGVQLLGPKGKQAHRDKGGLFTFVVEGHHHDSVSDLLDRRHGIATRNGCFCAHPLLHKLLGIRDVSKLVAKMETANRTGDYVEIPGATRASLGLYNTEAEIDLLADALADLVKSPAKPSGQPKRRMATVTSSAK